VLGYAWVIPVIPLASFLGIGFFGRRWGMKSSLVGIAAVGATLVLSLAVLISFAHARAGGPAAFDFAWLWARVGNIPISLGYQVDALTAIMLVMVSLVSLMVHIYSAGYMAGDVRYSRFYAVLSLFTAAMLALVLADNFLLLFVSWEIMGLCSYLLIGHWYERPSAAAAAMKAFMTTRVGDVGLLLGILVLFGATGTFSFGPLREALEAGHLSSGLVTAAALLVFMGAVGKSAQVPLHVWLPDAMEGPTPVSALIHAATMVAAGVYLVARSYVLFEHAPLALGVVAYVGTITAFLAATMATVATDIKRVLAYSTISQLGFMMVALGVGAPAAAVFHLVTHAFFKALLFLGSGSIIHATERQDLHELGGLYRHMPVTAWTFLVGTAALAGLPPFSGFFSKDEILAGAYHSHLPGVFVIGVVTAFLTAYYMTRAVCLAFFGRPRSAYHPHEAPPVMTGPLVVLAVLAAAAGWGGNFFAKLSGMEGAEHAAWEVMVLALGVALAGIALGVAVYGLGMVDRRRAIAALGPLYRLLKEKWYFDQAYYLIFVRPALAFSRILSRFDLAVIDQAVDGVGWGSAKTSQALAAFDLAAIDGAVNGVAAGTVVGGRVVRSSQTGLVRSYMLAVVLSLVAGLFTLCVMGGF
jgi:NADH-quinone oxidoreductase subunit L